MTPIDRLIAIEDIRQLKARYFRTVDTRDYPAMAETFCKDALFDFSECMTVHPLGGEPVGIGEMPFGFFTGIVNWYPTMPVSLQAKGFEPAEIPLPDRAKDSTSVPLFVVFDAAKPLRAGERPAPVLEWATVPPAANRTQTYLDVINLSTKENLQADVAGSKIALPKRKRVRVSNKAAATVRILPDGPNISISAGEGGGASQMLALVFSKPDGSIDYAVASEPDVQR